MSNFPKPRILIVSSVLPFPRNSGQEQRVYYTLRALKDNFHVTFLTVADKADKNSVQSKLLELCDSAIVLPSRYSSQRIGRFLFKLAGLLFELRSGLKFSNYLLGDVEFSPSRLEKVLEGKMFDEVIYEYWHMHRSTRIFRKRHIHTLLDMHDILWRSFARQLDINSKLPQWIKQWRVCRYQVREESAWNDFDGVIAINQDELEYTKQRVNSTIKMFYAPMGTDISAWPYTYQPVSSPRRVVYYGGLANRQNQRDAILCSQEILPIIWQQFPEVEFWIVGSNPPDFIKILEDDPRVHVTGFVENPQNILKTASLVLCPWSGIFGFRSRLVEVMSLGIPVVASQDAVFGMGFEIGNGIIVASTTYEMAMIGLNLLNDINELNRQSNLAREQIERIFSYEATYVKLANELFEMVNNRRYI